MKFENLPQEVINGAIDDMIACNPNAPMARSDWFEYIEDTYNVIVDKFTGAIYLEPR